MIEIVNTERSGSRRRKARAYEVERVSRTVTIIRVHADNVLAAKERVRMGDGEAVSSETSDGRVGRAWREPEGDR